MLHDVYCCRGKRARIHHPQPVPSDKEGVSGKGREGVAAHAVSLSTYLSACCGTFTVAEVNIRGYNIHSLFQVKGMRRTKESGCSRCQIVYLSVAEVNMRDLYRILRNLYCYRGEHARIQHSQPVPSEGNEKDEREWLLTLSDYLSIYLSICMLRDFYCCRGEHARVQHPQPVPGDGDGVGGEGPARMATYAGHGPHEHSARVQVPRLPAGKDAHASKP